MIATLNVPDRDGDTIISASPLSSLALSREGSTGEPLRLSAPLTPAGRLLASWNHGDGDDQIGLGVHAPGGEGTPSVPRVEA